MQKTKGNRIAEIFDEVARGSSLERVLHLVADQVAADLGAPTCKVWVVKRGDICERCPLAGVCAKKEVCLHLTAASGAALEKEYPRVPLSVLNATLLKRGGIQEFGEGEDPGEKLFGLQRGAANEFRNSFALYPLRGGTGTVGLVGVFNHRLIEEHELAAIAQVAPAAVTAIRVAEIQSKCDSLRGLLEKGSAEVAAVQQSARERENELEDAVAQLTQQVAVLQVERDSLVRAMQEDTQRIGQLEEEARQERERADGMFARQREHGRAYSELTAHIESERREIEEENAWLRSRVAELEQDLSAATSQRDALMNEVAERNLVIEGIRTELDLKQFELAEAREALPRLEERVAILEEANAGLREHNTTVMEGLDDLERSLRIAEDARARLEQTRVLLEERLAGLNEELERSRAEQLRVSAENERLRGDVARLREHNQSRAAAPPEELAQSRARAQELEEENAALRQANSRLEEAVGRFKSLADRLTENKVKLRDQMHASQREYHEKLAETGARVEALEQENAALSAARAQLEEAVLRSEAQTRQLEERLQEHARQNLEGLARAPLPANLAHELRTPMNAIIGFMSLLLEDSAFQLTDRHRRALERILHNACDLLEFINNILDLSKIEAGRMEVYSEPADLRELIERAVTVAEPLKDSRSIAIATVVEDGLPPLRTDRTKLQQVLINLISNAVKFTQEGEVRIEARRDGEGRVHIAVKDTGIGIAEDDIPKIFEEFRQLGLPVNGSRPGTGLGLAIARRLVELLEGEIAVSSRLGEGSTFTVTLPIELEGRAAPGLATVAPLADPARAALVVDSDPASLYLMKKYLTEAGYSVAITDDAKRAAEIARLTKPAIMTVDANLPEGGFELMEAIARQHRAGWVIAVSADASAEQGAMAAGAKSFLRKPIERAELSQVLSFAQAHTPENVLVVDDDPDALDIVVAMMEGSGYATRTATSGRAALDEIAKARPDAIILDLMLPEMDGFEVVHRLSLNPEWQDIPVILVTALDLSHEERRALDMRVERIFQKGNLSRDSLLAELKTALSSPLMPCP
ncbi:MAG TPA: response regulator [Blastocatellia bacterium]|nr:response regulator [Blastocatellia bacterium]